MKNLLCGLLSSVRLNRNTYLLKFKRNTSTKIMKYLNVAEKNDAAKNIALHLSRGTSRRREGLSQYNKIYEFEADVMGQKSQMVMTSVSGHLLGLEFVGSYKNWQSCSPLTLFEAPVFKYCPENYEKIKKTLEREVRGCQGLIIWTDCDREGENIGFEIIEVCKAVKNSLRIYRAKFSEITSVSVWRALQNLEQPNKNISDAVDVRQELDLRIGAAFTRFQTLRLQKVFPSKLAESLVSYGSCQFPTLGFVVERYRAVENFVPEPFWKIKVNHTQNNLSVDFTWERIRLFDQQACNILYDICLENPTAKVCDVKTKPKSKWRPLPLDTVELEKQASRKLKINAKETMRLAEKLYTQGFISYPRTETNEFPKEMNLGTLVSQQTGDPNWGSFAQRIMDEGGPTPRQGNKSDKAHPPIHPTKYSNNLSGNEARLYEFIVRSFLACCSKDAQGQETTVTIDVSDEKFSASGLMITARNYLEVYPYDKWSSKEIHVYQTGQTFDPTRIEMVDGQTSPPNLLTEADLIALMEKHGIGTDATHADHIETIKSRSYVALADAIHFVPGLLGMGLVEGYDAMGLTISKPHLRAQLEADLKAISEGRKNPEVVLAEQIAKYREVYLTVTAEANKIDQALGLRFSEQPIEYRESMQNTLTETPSVLKCPKCGSDMVVRQKRSNAEEFYIGCLSFPNCKNAVWLPSIVKSIQVLPENCPQCGPNYKQIKLEWRNNSISHLYPPPYTACLGGCDLTLLELLQVNVSSVRSTRNNPQPNVPQRQNQSNHQSNNQSANRRQPLGEGPPQRAPTNPTQFLHPPQANRVQNVTRPPNARPTTNQSVMNTRPTTNQSVMNTRPPTNQSVPSRVQFPTPSSSEPDENSVMCNCNQPAVLLTVRKQNANYGKKFYKCAVGRENNGCDFFSWAPENSDSTNTLPTPPTWGNQSNVSQNRGGSSNQGWGGSGNSSDGWGMGNAAARDSYPTNDDNVMCDCGMPAKKLTVHKEGPNKGRSFYGCPKEFNARCNFFQWSDAAGSSTEWGGSSTTTTTSRGRGRGRGGTGTGGGNRGGGGSRGGGGRKCGLCKQEGHTRNRCPNADPS